MMLLKLIARKKIKTILAIVFVLCLFLFTFIIDTHDFVKRARVLTGHIVLDNITCYGDSSTNGSIDTFSIYETMNKTVSSKNIFFFQTNCFGSEGVVLKPRQLCAIESAALMNPNMSIYLLILSHSKFSNNTEDNVKMLLTNYNNIFIKRIYTNDYFKNTPLEDWWKSGVFYESYWPKSHMSDVLRFLTLWKVGGIYLDLDIVVKSSLENLTDFVGAEDAIDANAAVFGLGHTEIGRHVANMCIEDLRKNFRGDNWGNNGPGVITRVLQKLCSTKNVADMTTSKCQGFTVYPPSDFFPIPWKKWKLYFDAKEKNKTMDKIKNSRTIHLWNLHSKSERINVGDQVPYGIIANKYCPMTYNNCGKVF
ncbi:hypothetical protein HCN44_005837 [Aphidius gifuensis]|uniref:Alpha 1,4-glycosyltransferase domain-containing protein n=1 Tax=Aphidius gifuensis TaxID=684658 RepID=A0A834XUL6_APHGI|nr:lactosylceramide 4-alpha-galactosyltransferase-like isoform X2 [Aphidius gifuensis]KAF7993056.1 hypothetical protein HCN44_005837 [Aphidius gifuensis]